MGLVIKFILMVVIMFVIMTALLISILAVIMIRILSWSGFKYGFLSSLIVFLLLLLLIFALLHCLESLYGTIQIHIKRHLISSPALLLFGVFSCFFV